MGRLAASLALLLIWSVPDTFVTLSSRGAKLAARINLPPAGRPPYPAAVLLHGSGEVTGVELMEGPGRRLLALGIAVLAYDKRGVGQSTGEYTSIGPSNSVKMFDLLAADAIAGVGDLRRRTDIDPARIGLVGFSQAGWIAPLAASRSKTIAFLVIVSGPAVSVGEEIYYSGLAGEDPGSEQGVSDPEIDRRMREFKGPAGYDPGPVLRTLSTPSFWVLGENDRSIPVAKTIDTLERCRRELGRPITTHVIPGVNHRLMDATGRQTDFWRPIGSWLRTKGILR
jgi:dienelactone hydrolase